MEMGNGFADLTLCPVRPTLALWLFGAALIAAMCLFEDTLTILQSVEIEAIARFS